MRLVYISSGNIPSRWAHSVQAVKMAEALSAEVGQLTLLTTGSLLRSPIDRVDIDAWYGVRGGFRTLALPVRLRVEEPHFTHWDSPRFDWAAALYARLASPDLVYTRSAASRCCSATAASSAGPLIRSAPPSPPPTSTSGW